MDQYDVSTATYLKDCQCCADSDGHYFTSIIIFIIITYCTVLLLLCIIWVSMLPLRWIKTSILVV